MTARRGIDVGQSDIFLSTQTTESISSQPQQLQTEGEMQESMTYFFGGLSGLLFALSLSFFLQAPLVSAGVLFALFSGWTGRAIVQARHEKESPKS